ncbi:MAG: hypothetical protein HOA30_06890 [Rhodospirillaceae bacterium]|jgi:hypothetical protein|nr:hypothetical protein [Rhodospirillaceae bacterium]MBT3908155.1 hypothetical protein [Rhodospirillaceae bacterium]MBT5300090.1 hypothetical protein [Rhodospirillaceae bacterium]MBT6883766.1 hypothetical protein [Rhodospirillaceae bacterium]MBT7509585.1 hypothetical protein [Rhodospirillaceae bacterium]
MSAPHLTEDADRQTIETAQALIDKRGRASAMVYAGRRVDHLRAISA